MFIGSHPMQHLEDFFEAKDGFKLYYQAWIPENPKAVVQIIHGYAEHSSRYTFVVEKLTTNNYAVVTHDNRGHGKSEGIRGYVNKFEEYVDDAYTFTNEIIKKKFPTLPIFLLGHSMGSQIAQYVVALYADTFKGVILSGTGIKPGNTNPIVVFIGKIFSKLLPKLRIKTGLNREFISSDPAVVQAYKDDPYVFIETITARLGAEMLSYYNRIKAKLASVKIPVLIQKGKLDTSLVGEDILYADFGSEDKTLLLYDDMLHEVYNEAKEKREKVLADLVEWLESHL